MVLNKHVKSNLQTIGIVVLILLSIYFLYKIKILLILIFLSTVVALICRPITVFLCSKLRLSNSASSLWTLLLMICFAITMLSIFIPIILEQGKIVSEIDIDLVRRDLNELSEQASEYLGVEQIDLFVAIKNSDFMQNLNKEFLLHFSDFFLIYGSDVVIGIFTVLFISFFILRDDQLLVRAATSFATKNNERRVKVVMYKSRYLLTRYFLGLTLQTLIISILYFLLLYSLSLNNALAIGIVCAFLNIIPYLGPLIGSAAMSLIIVANNLAADFSTELLPKLTVATVGIIVIQLLDNLIFQPVIFSKSVKSHPLEVFIIIAMFGLLFGIAGMILAIPVYTTIKVICKEFFTEYKWVKRLTKDY